MNLNLSEQRLSAAKTATNKRNADNPKLTPWTSEQWCENELGVVLDVIYAAEMSKLKNMMAPVADEIISACGGNIEKIVTALETGKAAALKTLA